MPEEMCPSCKAGKLVETIRRPDGFEKIFSCGHKHFHVTVKDSITLSNSLSTQGELLFELYGKVFIGGTITNSKNIELIVDTNDKRYLTGFKITVEDTAEETITRAMEQAKRLTNYIGFQTNTVVRHKRPRISKKRNGKTEHTISISTDAIIVKEIGLDITTLFSLLDSDSPLNQRLAHAQNGLKSLLDNDFPQAIKDFFLVIEGTNLVKEAKYKCLRDAVSHIKLDAKRTLDGLKKEFGIDLKTGEHLNVNDPDIQDLLETEARKLSEIARNYIEGEIKKTVT